MTRLLQSLILLFLPFLIFHWLTFGDKTIGGPDYYYIGTAQYETQFAIKKKTFPLYLPGLCGGASSFAEPRVQLFHPISIIAANMPGYWEGNYRKITTVLKLFSLGVTQIIIFFFLRELKLNTFFSFIFSFITVYNLKMLDIFRFFTVESYIGHLLLAISTMWYYIRPTRLLGPLSVIFSTYLLVSSGHPQYAYLAFIGNIFLILIIPFYTSHILEETQNRIKSNLKYYSHILLFLILGIILCSAYIIPYYFDFILDNSERVNMSFYKACVCQDTMMGTINSIFNPFYSDVHGNFMSSSIVLIPIFLPLLFFLVTIPRTILLIWFIFLFTFLLSTGSNTNLYYLFWKYFPFADSFRIPQRVNTILPLIFLLILIWLVKAKPLQVIIFKKTYHIQLYAPLAVIVFIINILYNNPIILSNDSARYHPINIIQIPEFVMILSFILGCITLILIIFYCLLQNYRRIFSWSLIILIVTQVIIYFNYCTYICPGTNICPGSKQWPTFQQMEDKKKRGIFFIPPYNNYWKWHFATKLVSFHTQVKGFPLETRLARITKNYTGVSSNEEVYEKLAWARENDYVLIEGLDPKINTLNHNYVKTDQVLLDYSSYNKLIFKVVNQSPGFFVFSFPYAKQWEAYLNSKGTKIYKANGIEQAIWIPKGYHAIEFRYWSPAAFWGMLISHITLFGIIIFATFAIKRIKIRALLCTLTFISLCFAFYGLYKSLYNGTNLETKYLWTTPYKELASSKITIKNG